MAKATEGSLAPDRAVAASSKGTAQTDAQRVAGQMATRRLLLVGIPLFWSSWYIYNAYLSVYARSVGASMAMVGLIVGAYGFTQLVLRIPLGIASDRLGKRKPFVLLGAFIGALSCAVMLIAPKPGILLLGRGMAGIGAACWVPLSALLVASYPTNQVVKATSMATALSGVGNMLASAAGGELAKVAGVQVPFVVGIGLGLLATLLLAQIKEVPRASGKPASVAQLLSVGRVPMVLIVSLLAMLGQYIAWALPQAFVPIYAASLQATKAQLGWIMFVMQACNTLACFFAGWVSARLGTRWTVVLGGMLVIISAVTVPLMHTIPLLFLRSVLHGLGGGIAFPVLMGGALLAVPQERRGAAMGFYQAIYAIGMVAGPVISGLFADQLGLTTTFYITGGLALIMTVGALTLLPHRIHAVESATA